MRIFQCLCFGAVIYYYLALFTFHPLDASQFSVTIPARMTKNLCGDFGALISGYSRFYFGYSSYLLALPVLFTSMFGIWPRKRIIDSPAMLRRFLGVAAFSIIVNQGFFLLGTHFASFQPVYRFVGVFGQRIWTFFDLIIGRGGLITVSATLAACVVVIELKARKKLHRETPIRNEGELNENHL